MEVPEMVLPKDLPADTWAAQIRQWKSELMK